ncbi:hypothetical protein [Streptomyces aidingensis]|uniref:Uncharacterized protein n=1 Tax=Streptomyces aidingensis TaxID=910347 RepID=A0A1I1E168_9ACTN|nr:hypothetical protein [Streptomyces aidingensis]SFB80416.1 hypothetical protein SAMN05421773_10154 [Streptomyces aidingensis]
METAAAGAQADDALDRLMSREAVTVDLALGATADEMYAYLRHSAEASGGPAPTRHAAGVLASLEFTAVVGDPGEDRRMRDLEEGEPLDIALSLGFGGKDAIGLKRVDEQTFVRIGAETVVQDVLRGKPEDVSRTVRFMEHAAGLPGSLDTAARALAGSWVLVDPFRYPEYAAAIEAGITGAGRDAERAAEQTGGVGRAEDVAEALTGADPLLSPEAQWDMVARLENSVRTTGTRLHSLGKEDGTERMELTVPAGRAQQALGPLLDLLRGQSARFGLPPLVHDPADPDTPVTAVLTLRNGVLSEIEFDLAQFGGPGFPPLPLEIALTSGAAISLNPPRDTGQTLDPEDLTVALLYLALREEQREQDPNRGNLPGPVQP